MKLLQRTIFGEVLRVFTLVLTGITVVLVFVGVFQHASEMGLGPAQLIRIVPYVVPSLLPFTIPATLLLTVCIVYGRVSGDLELTAAKAAGINPIALLTPTILFGCVLSAFSFLLTDRVIPWAVQQITVVGVEAVEDIFLTRLRNERKYQDKSNDIEIIVAGVDEKRLIRPMIRFPSGDGEMVVVHTNGAVVHFDVPNRQVFVDVETGYVEMPDGTTLHSQVPQRIPLPLSQSFKTPNARHLSLVSIKDELQEHGSREQVRDAKHDLFAAMSLSAGDYDGFSDAVVKASVSDIITRKRCNKLRTESSSRYALSCSCLFFALLGSPFAMLRGQTQILTSFLYCFLPIIGAYYPLVLGLMTQSKSGSLDPTWTMWIGNALLFFAALVAIRKMCRH